MSRQAGLNLHPPAPRRKIKMKRCEETGKRGYRSKGDALTIAIRAVRNFKPQRVYRCPHCGLFHLTSKVGRR